jgi:hypothetical protein
MQKSACLFPGSNILHPATASRHMEVRSCCMCHFQPSQCFGEQWPHALVDSHPKFVESYLQIQGTRGGNLRRGCYHHVIDDKDFLFRL